MRDARVNIEIAEDRLDPAVFGLLTRVEIRESDSEPTVAALRFNLRQRGGNYRPLDDGVFTPAARLRIDLAAPGATPARVFDGYVTHVRPHFEPIESNCYVEVLAMDAAVLLDALERVASYPDVTDAEAAEEVFGRYDIPFAGQATGARHLQARQLLMQRESDWTFVRRLARRNGFVCYFETDAASGRVAGHFHPPDVDGTPQPDLAPLGDLANLSWLDFQLATTGPARHVAAAIDPLAKRLLAGDGAPALPAMGGTPLGSLIDGSLSQAGSGGATAMLFDPAPLSEAIAAQASAATDRAVFALEARGEISASVYRGLLRARRPVLIKDVGALLAGSYYVRAVRTTLDEGTLVQSFVALRNAVETTGREEFGRRAEGASA
jgi:hypothetical protein